MRQLARNILEFIGALIAFCAFLAVLVTGLWTWGLIGLIPATAYAVLCVVVTLLLCRPIGRWTGGRLGFGH